MVFEDLIEKIRAHPSYGPALKEASAATAPLILDYHTHTQGPPFCVAIGVAEENPLKILGQPDQRKELAHIKGIGQREEDCVPMMTVFGKELKEAYQLASQPVIYLNGVAVLTSS